MAEEAVIENEQEETTAQETAEEKSPVEAFEEFLSGAAEKPEGEAAAETEQQPGDEPSAEADAGEQAEETTEPVVTEPVAEGPSFLMKQAALQAGLPPQFVEQAPNDAALQWMVQALHTAGQQTQQAPAREDEPFKVSLPEDEYGPDDPIRKEFQRFSEQFTAERAERKKVEAELSALKKERDEQFAREETKARDSYYAPFDEALDSLNDPKFGTYGKLSPAQQQARYAVSERFRGLGATLDTPADERKRLAMLAVDAFDRSIIENHNKKLQAAKTQPKRVTGGGHARDVRPKETADDLLRRLDEANRTGNVALLTE